MRVQIVTQSAVLSKAMELLVTDLGFEVCGPRLWTDRDADVVLEDCIRHGAPYPVSPSLPTVALISGDDKEGQKWLEQGYAGYLTPTSDTQMLKATLVRAWQHKPKEGSRQEQEQNRPLPRAVLS